MRQGSQSTVSPALFIWYVIIGNLFAHIWRLQDHCADYEDNVWGTWPVTKSQLYGEL